MNGGTDGGGSRPPVDCGDVQVWDTDGDRISDSLEASNRGFHAFSPTACDRDPSAARGKPSSGSLVSGLNLTDEGGGYVHLRGSDGPDTDDWATLPLLSCIEAVGRDAETMAIRLTINDLSLRAGGPFVPHSSHQNGLDADVRYVRRDGRVAPLDIRSTPGDYDAVTTQALLQAFVRRCSVSAIFVDLPSLGFTNEELDSPVLVQAPGHTNHFHVRLRPPS
jgi:murein endopeptidase